MAPGRRQRRPQRLRPNAKVTSSNRGVTRVAHGTTGVICAPCRDEKRVNLPDHVGVLFSGRVLSGPAGGARTRPGGGIVEKQSSASRLASDAGQVLSRRRMFKRAAGVAVVGAA